MTILNWNLYKLLARDSSFQGACSQQTPTWLIQLEKTGFSFVAHKRIQLIFSVTYIPSCPILQRPAFTNSKQISCSSSIESIFVQHLKSNNRSEHVSTFFETTKEPRNAWNNTNTKRYKYWHITILHVHRKDWNYATDDVNGPFHGVQSNWRIFPSTSERAQKKNNEATISQRYGGWQVRMKQRNTQRKHAWQVKKMKVALWELAFCLNRLRPLETLFPDFNAVKIW